MKKIILLAIGILTSVTMLADTIEGYQYQSLTYKYNTDTKEATLTFGGTVNGEEQNKIATWTVKIPKFIKVKSNETEDSIQYKVTRIGKGAFQYNQDVNHLIIPDEVTTIEEQAFLNMSNLRLIELPEKIGSIANNAFQNCNSLAHIWCKNPNPSTISPSIFGNKDKCMMLYVPAGFALKNEENWIKVFEDRIYEGDMVIRKSPDEKRTYICAKKNNNTGIATLFEWKNGENDTDITISASFPYNNESYVVKNIGSNVFTSPQFIKILSIEEGITRICNQAFKNCQIMRRITLPSTLNYIGSDAFLNCSYISHICCKVSDPFTLSEYSSRFPKNEMMTLYVPTSSYMNGSYPWFELFKGRIYQGEMNVVPDNGMTYIVASDSYEATLYEVTDKNVVDVNFSIPNNVTGIDRQAFLNCTKISSLKNIPNTVTAIGPDAFKSCSGLEEIKLPSSLKMIGAYAFSGCSKLVRVESEIQNLFNIRDDLFTNANGNEKILYHVNSSFGSEEEFKGWKNGFTYKLKGTRSDITYPYKDEQGEHVYNMTFTSATGSKDAVLIKVSKVPNVSYDLNKIEVPNTLGNNVSVIGIFKEAFSNVPNLDQLTFNDSIAGSLRIGKDALKGCPNLRILKLPSHLTELGSMAFSSNGKLAHILFKSYNNRTSIIGSDVFGNYTKNNATIYIPSANYIESKGDLVEKGWNMNNIIVADILEEFNDTQDGMGMTYIGWKKDAEEAGTARLTKGVRGTPEAEFLIRPTATSPKDNTYNVTAIAGEAFKGIGANFKNLTISEGIKEIGISAFQGCSKIEKVVLPTTLSKIGESAFMGCSNLADINSTSGEDSLKITEIGASAFYNCTNLEKITLPSTLESIGLNAFAGCSKLTEIESFIGTPLDIDETVFPNYSATLYVPCESRDAYLNAPVWKNFTENHISAGERIVYEDEESGLKYAYASCGTTATLIKSEPIMDNIVILDSIGSNIVVTEIASSALKDKKIVSLKIPEGVTSIGASAFENCTKLNKIELPKSLVSIGDQAFGNCGNIKMIISKIPAGNLEQLCSSIEKVFLSDKAPTVKPSPDNIYIPVGENSKSIYTSQWKNIFEKEDKFIVGYPDFDKDEENQRKWRFNFLTTFDEENVTEEISASTLYGTATLIKAGYRGETDGNLILPDTVTFEGKRYQVTAIGDNAFNDYPEKSSVVTLKISENVDSIGKYAFNGFSEVKKIWLPSSLKLIKEWAFNGCNKITHVCSQMVNPQPMGDKLFPSIPTNNTATLFIPSEEGYNNDSWTKFSNLVVGTFVNDYKEDNGIIYSCYTNATGDTKAIVTKAETNYIKEALIKDSVTLGELKEGTNDKIYYKITSIGKYAFQLCTQLETLELPSKLEAIGSKAFVNSPNIRTIVSLVPGGVVGSLNDNITNVFSTPSPTPEKIYVPTDAVNPYKEAWKDLFTTDNTKYIVGYPGYDGKGENGWLYDYITVDNKAIEETQNTATLKKAIQSAADENHVLPIPSEVTISEKKYKVTKIGDNAFNGYEGKNSDVELNIPETITEIGKNAFNGFSKLEKVRLLKSLKSIGSMAFSGCSSITHVCSEMESPIMGDDVFSTPSPTATFFVPTLEGYNTNILDKFPNVVVGKFDGEKHEGELKYSCYTDADGNPKAILTKSETSIQEALIKDTVKISEEDYTVTTIGKNAFNGCAKLKKLVLPSTLTSIGNVPPIGDNAFVDCVVLDDIVSDIKGDDLKPIPTNIFSEYTRNNAKVYVPDSVTKYKETEGWDVFKSSDPDNYIVGKWVDSEVQDDFMQYRYHTGNHDAIVIKIDFPNDEHKTLPIKREVRFDNDPVKYLVSTIAPTSITNKERIDTIIIDNGISTIEADAFKGCTSLKNVEFPSSLTAIGNSAFQGCTNLQKIWLPAALVSIGSKAFNGCNLTRVSTKALPYIDKDVFSSYGAYLFVPKGTSVNGSWGDFAGVYEGNYLGEITPNNDKTYICLMQDDGKGTAVLTDSKTSNVIKSPIQFKIDENNVIDCDVTIIGESAFNKNKHNLEEWNKLPSTVEVVEANAFKNCNLKSLELPATLKSIGDYAFSGNNIETLELPSTLTTIGDGAFKNCTNLNKMELPSTLTKIGTDIFEDCSNLKEVVCKVSVKDVVKSTQSIPNTILYIKEGTGSYYDNWSCLHILEGDKKLGSYMGLQYAYIDTEKDKLAVLIGVDKEADVDKEVLTDGALIIPPVARLGNDFYSNVYDVIAIDKDAFNDIKTKIKTVTFGEGELIKKIAKGAFEGCNNLTDVICKGDDNQFIKDNPLSLPNATLYVVKGHKEWYENAGWNFAHIYQGERQVEVTDDGYVYAYSAGSGEAILVGIPETTDNIRIPDVISIGDPADNYNVVDIADYVFKDNVEIKEVVSKITNTTVIGGITLSIPKAILYVPNEDMVDVYKATWKFADYYVGDRLTTEIKGMTYVCATGSNKATLVKTDEDALDKNVNIEGPISITVKKDGEADKVYSFDEIAIGDNAFSGTNIVSLELDDHVKTIGANTFQGCSNLSWIWLPSTLTSIGEKAFEKCDNIAYICTKSGTPLASPNISNNVFSKYNATLYVPDGALSSYENSDVWKYFPIKREGDFKGIKKIKDQTYECFVTGDGGTAKPVAILTKSETTDKEVKIESSVKLDGDNYTSYIVTAIDEYTFNKNPNRGQMVKLIISENIKTIGANAFQSCNNLKKVWLPATLTSIGTKAFDGCNNITHVSSKVNNPALISENVFPTSATLFVPNGTKGDYSTAKFSYVAEGEFVDEVTDNGYTYDCLTSKKAILKKYTGSSNEVEIPSSVTLGGTLYTVAVIAKSSFASKSGITSLVIPAGVEEIDAETFSKCNSLKWIESKIENPINISNNVFANYTATLFIPSNKVTEYENKGWKFLNIFVGARKETTTPDGCTYVYSTGDKKAILTKVTANDKDVTVNGAFKIGKDEYTVTAIAESVYKGKTNMVTLKISENIKNIGTNAFMGCTKLEKVEFPATLKKIGSKAFDGCVGLVSLTCQGKEPAEIGTDAFPSYNVTVNVPNDALEKYKNNSSWGGFTKILGISTSLTDDASGDYIITTPTGGDETPTVKLWNGMDALGDYVIPETVTIDGSDYKVSAIDEGACENNINMTSVTIPSTISSIGESAFAGCYNLKSITVYNETPINLPMSAATRGALTRSGSCSVFEGVNKNTCILYVPAGSVDAYKAKPGWNEFKNILAIGTTAINGVVISDDGKPFDIYNMQGRKVKDNVTSFDGLPSGIYIVNGKKVMVK